MARILVAALLLLLPSTAALAQRLPGGVVPLHYELTVAPDLAAAKFTGEETIRVRVEKPTTKIVLNAAEIAFRDVRITAGPTTQTATVTLDDKAQQATFTVPAAIPAGDAEIAIAYDGILNDDLRGLYLSKANNRRYAVTQLEATDARRMFPSFDEPALKATFSLTAIIDAGDHAISNGAVISDTPGPGAGRHTLKFETTPPMSTYLVALAVGDFECIGGDAGGTPIRVCATPDKKALTGFALEAAQQAVTYFNGYYSIDYPFKKLDIVAVPDFSAGAMENTAAIFYRETLLLAPPDASVGVRKQIATVLAHEIAHQWFGDLVTMEWWDDIWLNEGFANWMMSKPVEAWRPDWNVQLDEIQDNHTAMRLDALRSTRAVRTKASTPDEINELFDPIAYEKGAAVLRMLESWVGEDEFRKGVNAYIEKYKFGNARAEDFWGTLTEATRKPVDEVMKTFVDQPGLPLVTLRVQCTPAPGSGGRGAETMVVTATQQRYTRDPAAAKTAPAGAWRIPVCVRLQTGATQCEVLAPGRETLRLQTCPTCATSGAQNAAAPPARQSSAPEALQADGCSEWIMGNAGGRGYYVTALPPAVVRSMAAGVSTLTPAERMVVLNDELVLVQAGRHDVGTLLDLAAGFGSERTTDVVQALGTVLGAVGQTIATDATRPEFRAFVSTLLTPALEDVGTATAVSDSDARKSLRAAVLTILGRTARDPRVLASARTIVEQELEKPGSVDRTLLGVVVDLAAYNGDAALYDRYLARSQAATSPDERYRYLYALTSFSDPALVRRTMDLALSPDVRSQDTKLVVGQMLMNPESRDLAWDLLRQRWDELQKKTGESVGNGLVVGALGTFCDAGTAAEIKTFFGTHPVPDAERTLQQSLERIASCVQLSATQSPKLANWLSQR